MKHPTLFRAIVGGFALLVGSVSAVAQASSYQQTNLVSDLAGAAVHTDPKLINPWGIAFVPGRTFRGCRQQQRIFDFLRCQRRLAG